VASRLVSHLRLWVIAAPLVLVVLTPLLPDDKDFEVQPPEQASVDSVLGVARADRAAARANTQFGRWFVDSGAMHWSYRGSLEVTDVHDAGLSDASSSWLKHFWMAIYRAVYRAQVAATWLVGALALAAAMLNDGAVHRRIKASAAGVASPVGFHLAAHALLLVVGCAASAFLLPLPLPAFTWSIGSALIGALVWRLASTYYTNR
jgi:hypothetical protein